MDREKIIKKDEYSIKTGYYNENNQYIIHSFDGEPAIFLYNGSKEWWKDGKIHRENNLPAVILNDGVKFWYDNNRKFWVIDNQRYNSLDYVLEKYKDKIILLDRRILHKMDELGIEFIYVCPTYGIEVKYYLIILDDMQRNEVILRYG